MDNNHSSHFLSDSAVWETVSEFLGPDGKVSEGTGESVINIDGNLITNESWVTIQDNRMENRYEIRPLSVNRLQYTSKNPALGIQTGYFDISENIIYSKFAVQGTALNGYEIIRREDCICYANGALYNGDGLINTWNAVLGKKKL